MAFNNLKVQNAFKTYLHDRSNDLEKPTTYFGLPTVAQRRLSILNQTIFPLNATITTEWRVFPSSSQLQSCEEKLKRNNHDKHHFWWTAMKHRRKHKSGSSYSKE